ncbi:hypothetical protein H6B10_17460, partial [Gemmiger formicilis]|nr:hypothetical protein [Gemmiger formicilis]
TVDVHQNDFAGTAGAESFVSLLIVDGEGTVTCGGETMPWQMACSVPEGMKNTSPLCTGAALSTSVRVLSLMRR